MEKYKRWYKQLMDRAKSRVLLHNFERHHIKPKCLPFLGHKHSAKTKKQMSLARMGNQNARRK